MMGVYHYEILVYVMSRLEPNYLSIPAADAALNTFPAQPSLPTSAAPSIRFKRVTPTAPSWGKRLQVTYTGMDQRASPKLSAGARMRGVVGTQNSSQ